MIIESSRMQIVTEQTSARCSSGSPEEREGEEAPRLLASSGDVRFWWDEVARHIQVCTGLGTGTRSRLDPAPVTNPCLPPSVSALSHQKRQFISL